MAMRADPVPAALAAVVAVALVMIDDRVSGGRFRQAGRRVDSGRKEEGGEDKSHRHDQLRPCRHRPGHRALHTFVLEVRQCVTESAPRLPMWPTMPVTHTDPLTAATPRLSMRSFQLQTHAERAARLHIDANSPLPVRRSEAVP